MIFTSLPEGGTWVYRTAEDWQHVPETIGDRGVWYHDREPMPGGYSLNPPAYDSYAGGVELPPPPSVKTPVFTIPTNGGAKVDTSIPSSEEKFKPIVAENVFGKYFDVIKQTLEDSAVRLISQNKKVQEKIEEQKVVIGKDVLWQYIPFILIGTILLALIIRFKK